MLSFQVNLHTIVKNVASIKKHLNHGTRFCAVLKDNAYGFGLIRIGQVLAPYVDCFAVATVAEGITLRQIGIKQDILLFGICDDIRSAVNHNLIITIENISQIQAMQKAQLHPRIHIAVNTGMNRFGFSSIHELRAALKLLNGERIEGIYTHLAYECDHPQAIQAALHHFKKFTHVCKQHFPHVLVHAGCSGVISYPAAHFDMVRIGKALYGGTPETQTAFTITSQIITVKKIKTGATVGYNGTFTATHPTAIGIMRGGYANGIPPQFGGTVNVLVGKQRCPIIGRVCMEYCFIDVSQVVNPVSQPVTIIAPKNGQTLLDIAHQAQMVTCNLLQGIASAQNNN
ncbi:MAG: alanine racemase [Clostridia bacterium]|nr:alanine racemase [Clostridia bacterium]